MMAKISIAGIYTTKPMSRTLAIFTDFAGVKPAKEVKIQWTKFLTQYIADESILIYHSFGAAFSKYLLPPRI